MSSRFCDKYARADLFGFGFISVELVMEISRKVTHGWFEIKYLESYLELRSIAMLTVGSCLRDVSVRVEFSTDCEPALPHQSCISQERTGSRSRWLPYKVSGSSINCGTTKFSMKSVLEFLRWNEVKDMEGEPKKAIAPLVVSASLSEREIIDYEYPQEGC